MLLLSKKRTENKLRINLAWWKSFKTLIQTVSTKPISIVLTENEGKVVRDNGYGHVPSNVLEAVKRQAAT